MFKERLKLVKKDLQKVQDEIEWMIAESTQTTKIPTINEKILKIAALQIGVKEVSGPLNNPKVMEYHKYATKNNDVDQPDSVPWCSSFLCYVVEKGAGIESTNSMTARSWLKWGESSLKAPLPGDIVVYWRVAKSSWQGHCGVYLRTNADGSIVTLGGNQNDEVNITSYSSNKLLDIKRYETTVLDNQDSKVLKDYAHALINGRIVGADGKVS